MGGGGEGVRGVRGEWDFKIRISLFGGFPKADFRPEAGKFHPRLDQTGRPQAQALDLHTWSAFARPGGGSKGVITEALK